MPSACIKEFTGKYRFLSNFYRARVELDGVEYPSVEHTYQAAKTLSNAERRKIQAMPTPGQAKRCGRKVALRTDWERVKLSVMRDLVLQKFTGDLVLADMLLGTGDAELVEGNWWGDTFWGVCDGEGENHLGKILMKTRDILRRTTKAS